MFEQYLFVICVWLVVFYVLIFVVFGKEFGVVEGYIVGGCFGVFFDVFFVCWFVVVVSVDLVIGFDFVLEGVVVVYFGGVCQQEICCLFYQEVVDGVQMGVYVVDCFGVWQGFFVFVVVVFDDQYIVFQIVWVEFDVYWYVFEFLVVVFEIVGYVVVFVYFDVQVLGVQFGGQFFVFLYYLVEVVFVVYWNYNYLNGCDVGWYYQFGVVVVGYDDGFDDVVGDGLGGCVCEFFFLFVGLVFYIEGLVEVLVEVV